MSGLTQVSSKGLQYGSLRNEGWSGRPVAGVTYLPGMILQTVSADLAVFTDGETVTIPSVGTLRTKLRGVVKQDWDGFGPAGTANNYASPASLLALRGTIEVPYTRKGFHPGILIDQAGTGAVTLTDGLGIVACGASGTAGYGQGIGVAAATPMTVIGQVSLPASGIGSSITAAARAQASQTATVAGTPAVGDTLSVTIQSPYTATTANTAQTKTWTTPVLTTAQAVSVTTAAAALVAYLNAQPDFSTYFVATNVNGVVTVTVNGLAALFRIYWGPGLQGETFSNFIDIAIDGMVANSLTFACAATGGSTNTAGAANLASGTGYKGPLPGYVCSTL